MSTILARVVETPKPKRPRLWLKIKKINSDWCGGAITEVRSTADDWFVQPADLVCIPGSDEELTPERIEAAIEAVFQKYTDGDDREFGWAKDAMRELVRRLGLIESEGT